MGEVAAVAPYSAPIVQSSHGGQWQLIKASAKNSTNLDTTRGRAAFHTLSTRSVAGGALTIAPVSSKPTTSGIQHGNIGWPSIRGLQPHPRRPNQNGKAVDQVGGCPCRQACQDMRPCRVLVGSGPDGLGQIFQVQPVEMPVPGGDDAEVVKRVLGPFQELLPAPCDYVVFAVDVHLERTRVANSSDSWTEWSMDQIGLAQRVDLAARRAQALMPSRMAARSHAARR